MSHPPVRRPRANPPDAGDAKVPWLGGLDGIRALAVAAVVLFHAGVAFLPAGFLGVDVFFVVSGFLITALLVAERERSGGIALADFWKRRAKRLLPALAALLIGTTLFAAAVYQDQLLDQLRGVVAAAAYLTNWDLILRDVSYFDQFERPSQLRHLWSLAVEEQFYLLWPLLFFAVLRLAGARWLRRLTWLAALGALASLIWMAILYEPGADPSRVYFGSDARAFTILLGVLLGLHWKPWRRDWGRVSGAALDLLGAGGLAVVAWIMVAARESDAWMYPWGLLALSAAALATVAAAARNGGLISHALAARPLRWLGERSYAIYLWHWPVLIALEWEQGITYASPGLLAAGGAITLVLAAASYEWIERPAREGRFWRQFGLRRVRIPRAVWAGSAAAVIAAAAAAGFFAFPSQRADHPQAAGTGGAAPLQIIAPVASAAAASTPPPAAGSGGTRTEIAPRTDGSAAALPLKPAQPEPIERTAPDAPETAPAPDEEQEPSEGPAVASTPQPPAEPPGADHPLVEFAVLPGDTPFRLAAAFGITLDRLMEINGDDILAHIRIGQVLRAPCPTAAPCAIIEIAPVGEACVSWAGPAGAVSTCQPARAVVPLPAVFELEPAPGGGPARWTWGRGEYGLRRGEDRFELSPELAAATQPAARVLGIIHGSPPLAIGDSVMAGAARALRTAGIEVDALGARTARGSIAALHDHLERGGPRSVVIFHGIGWNFLEAADFERLREAARGVDRLIVLTTQFRGRHGRLSALESVVNEMLREQARKHPEVILLDWHRISDQRTDELTYDGAHLTAAGIALYVESIVGAVAGDPEDDSGDLLLIEE